MIFLTIRNSLWTKLVGYLVFGIKLKVTLKSPFLINFYHETNNLLSLNTDLI